MKANSSNLLSVDFFMLQFLQKDVRFNAADIRDAKAVC